MNVRDLQYLVAVHDEGSFSKAAQRCFVSQPTLSGQLKKLEEELDVVLMERTTRKVLFTPIGLRIVAQAKEVLFGVKSIRDIAESEGDMMSGEVNIGLIPTVGPYLLPFMMPELIKQYAALKTYLHEHQTAVLLEKLQAGELDCLILAKLDWDGDFHEIALFDEPMCLAVQERHPLVHSANEADLSVLRDQQVLMLADGHCLRNQAMGVCFSAGAREDSRFQATSMDTLLHMIASGVGMTLVPKLLTRNSIEGVCFVTLKPPQPSRKIVLLARRNSPRIAMFDKLANIIRQSVAKMM